MACYLGLRRMIRKIWKILVIFCISYITKFRLLKYAFKSFESSIKMTFSEFGPKFVDEKKFYMYPLLFLQYNIYIHESHRKKTIGLIHLVIFLVKHPRSEN